MVKTGTKDLERHVSEKGTQVSKMYMQKMLSARLSDWYILVRKDASTNTVLR